MKTGEFKSKVLSLSSRLFPMVNRMLGSEHKAADALQEIMMKLWNKRRTIVQHPNITGFVVLTARNYCLDLLKKRKQSFVDSDEIIEVGISDKGFEEIEWKELKAIIDKILMTLPTMQKEVMLMRDIDGLEFEEIALATNLKVEHVRVLLSRARKKVALELRTKYSYEN